MNKANQMNKIKIIHWNCFKLNQNKCKELENFLDKNSPDIMCLNEVKLDENKANFFLNFTNYVTIYKPRQINSNYGGGVAMLIRSNLDFVETSIFKNLKLEIVEIKIKLAQRDCHVLAYYNPPNSELSEIVFKTLSDTNSNYIICGDLNSKAHSIGCLNNENTNGKILEQILVNFNGQIINNIEPTYHQSGSQYKEMLDLFICSPLLASTVSSFRILKESLLPIIDHDPIEVVFDLAPQKHSDTTMTEKFDYTRADWMKFKAILQNIQIKETHIDDLNNILTKEILAAADQSIPTLSMTKRSSSLPPFILKMIKKRREIRNKILKSNPTDPTLKAECNKIKKEIDKAIGERIDNNWNKFMKKCGRSPLSAKPFWNKINNFRSNQTNRTIPTLTQNNVNYETDSEKANVFSEMLEKIFNDKDDTSFDENFKKKVEEENSKFNYSNLNQKYKEILPIDIVLALKELPLGSSPGPDGLSNDMLKKLPPNMIDQIATLANKSLRECYLPGIWKTAQMTMIHKKDDKSDPNNYRPISLTSCLGKLIERVINKRLYNYIESKNLFVPQQSGFRKKRRCADNLLFLTQKIKESFNRGKKAMLLLFDIQKAFDKV